MKKIILTLILVFIALPATAQIHGVLSFDGGNVIIQKGSRAPEVIRHMGQPLYIDYQTYCSQYRNNICINWANREIWFYEHRRTDYELTIQGGVVRNVKWGGYKR